MTKMDIIYMALIDIKDIEMEHIMMMKDMTIEE